MFYSTEHSRSETLCAWTCVFAGGAVAAAVSLHDEFWLGNFVFLWVIQLTLLFCMLIEGPRPAAISGAALALAGYLGGGYGLLFLSGERDTGFWAVYAMNAPLALLGWIGLAICRRRLPQSAWRLAGIAAIAVAGGIALPWLILMAAAIVTMPFTTPGLH